MATARLSVFGLNDNGHEHITDIQEFAVPDDAAKRRRLLMRKIGAIIDASSNDNGPTGLHVTFSDIA